MTEAVLGQSFSFARVFRRATSALVDNIAVFGVLTLLFYILPLGVTQLIFGAPATISTTGSTSTLASVVVGFFVGPLLQISVTVAALAYFDGKPVDLPKSVSAIARNYSRVLGVIVLRNIGVGIGLILVLVPGLFLATMWAVVVPAAIESEMGDSSFERSAQLTAGYRRPIFGLMLLFCLGLLALAIALAALFVAIGMVIGIDFLNETGGVMDIAFGLLIEAPLMLFSAVGIAAVYHELRFIKEGAGASSLAEVFA